MRDLVSIIMPSYNTQEYIGSTIESVLGQTYTNWELIIVDDGSNDHTDEIINSFLQDSRIRYFKNKENSGAAVSRNFALKKARGKWIAFLDSDDLWMPRKLERQILYMEKNKYFFSYTDYKIEFNGELMPYIYTGPAVVTPRKMKDYCYFSTITVMYDRDYVGLIQIVPIRKNNDYAMWLQIIKKTPCYRMPECLSVYRKHDGSISSGSKWKLIRHHYILWKKAMRKNTAAALLLTIRNLFFGVIKKIIYRKSDASVLKEEK